MFDSNRAQLPAVYMEPSFFTIGIPRVGSKKDKMQDMSRYIPLNRNLETVKGERPRAERVFVGAARIAEALAGLPSTEHQVADCDVTIDTIIPGGIEGVQLMQVTIHGIFLEEPVAEKQGRIPPYRRAFHRTLMITPAPAGSPAAQLGLGAVVCNDHLLIRSAPRSARTAAILPIGAAPPSPQVTPSGPAISGTVPSLTAATVPSLTVSPAGAAAGSDAIRQRMVATLADATGMTPAYSAQCLESTAWNYDAALSAFSKARAAGQLPPDAFVR
jgi:nuclear RNA export factor/TAP C-terminal domain-containing protein